MRLEELEEELMACARKMRRMSSRTELQRKPTNDRQIRQHGISESSLALQDELHEAIEQGHNSTCLLRNAMASLQQQIHQGGSSSAELEQRRGDDCSRQTEDEVERWKGQCRALQELQEGVQSGEAMRLEEIESDRRSLRAENADLRRTLEQREEELSGWKEDCLFFAVKLMNWGPSLRRCSPALHHELERRLLRRPKTKNYSEKRVPDRKSKAHRNVVLRSNITEESVAEATGHRPRDEILKGCEPDDRLWTEKLLSSKKRKCISCSSAVVRSAGSPSSTEFQR